MEGTRMSKGAAFFAAAILLAGLMLSGCASGSPTNGASGGSAAGGTAGSGQEAPKQEPQNQEQAQTPEKNPYEEAFTIRLSAWNIDERTVMQEFKNNIIAKYKELYPNAVIQWDVTLGSTYFDKLKAELASNTAADVIFSQNNTLPQFVEAGYFVDLSDQPWVERLRPGTERATRVNGKVYAATLGMSGSGIWYNKDLFNELGLEPPKTWADFVAIGDKLIAAGKIPMALGFKDMWTVSMFLTNLANSQLYGIDPKMGRLYYDGEKTLDGPEMQDVMRKIEALTQQGFFNKTALTIDWPQSAELFTSGQAAMITQGAYMPETAADNFKNKGHTPFEIGYFQFPDENGFYNIVVSTGESISVNAKSQLQQQAKDLISVILSEDVLAAYDIGNGQLPPFTGMKVDYPNAAMSDFLDYVDKGHTYYGVNSYIPSSAWSSLQEVVTKIVSGAKFDPADLKDAQAKLEKDRASVILPED